MDDGVRVGAPRGGSHLLPFLITRCHRDLEPAGVGDEVAVLSDVEVESHPPVTVDAGVNLPERRLPWCEIGDVEAAAVGVECEPTGGSCFGNRMPDRRGGRRGAENPETTTHESAGGEDAEPP
ncbi:hypothetical protein DEI91_00185 [Curtobacterium sp. MCBD17_032]|nr:hypothetical protein DEI91_00185 [Curtobacterium sp. MCBD17_032]